MERPTPRCNSTTLTRYPNKLIRLAGRVLRVDNDLLVLEASDQGQVRVKLRDGSAESITDQYVEIIGRVSSNDNLVTEMTFTNFGDDFDLKGWESVVNISHANPKEFGLDQLD